jgi:steroid 5-alpha reductase family enzyme
MMAALWILHLRLRNAAIVDVGWAAGLPILAGWYAWALAGGTRGWLLAAMVAVWGSRLATHLMVDRVVGQPEEGRYRELRRRWKTRLGIKFFVFFQAQAVLDVLLAVPFLLASRAGGQPGVVGLIAAALWLLAMSGEALADRQLAAFKRDPLNRGRVCENGLWRYSRHPNYFFEWLVWVAYALYATTAPYGWAGWLSPALILFFLFRVTGIPETEAQAVRSRGEAYRRYQRTTSAFVPWFRREVSS